MDKELNTVFLLLFPAYFICRISFLLTCMIALMCFTCVSELTCASFSGSSHFTCADFLFQWQVVGCFEVECLTEFFGLCPRSRPNQASLGSFLHRSCKSESKQTLIMTIKRRRSPGVIRLSQCSCKQQDVITTGVR